MFFLNHGFLPDNMMSVILVHIIKDKSGQISDIKNYRPIALASFVSKLFEILLVNRMSSFLNSFDNQLGFNKKHSTDMCVYVFKELISRYKSLGSNIFTCFLDASKAFDRVAHHTLFKKLIKCGVPTYLIRILVFWCSHQNMYIRWNGILSPGFKISNRVLQGSILSPDLFSLYMNDLSDNVRNIKTGCVVSKTITNHLMYTDDIVLFSPSASGLQHLLNECNRFGLSHDVKFNSEKSKIMIFTQSQYKDVNFGTFIVDVDGGNVEVVDSYKYLGHWISCDMLDHLDISRQIRQIYAQANTLVT